MLNVLDLNAIHGDGDPEHDWWPQTIIGMDPTLEYSNALDLKVLDLNFPRLDILNPKNLDWNGDLEHD